MSQPITIEALEVLDAIDRKGSFAAAANILYRVPSAITYTVQKLEQDLGIRLFIKQGRRSVLTPAGIVLLEQGREILEATRRLAETAREVDSGWESSISICVDSVLGVEHLYPMLNEFCGIKADLEINLYEETLSGGWEALIEDRADLAVGVVAKPGEVSGFYCESYKEVQWVFAFTADHPLASKEPPLSKEDIQSYRAVVVRDSSISQPALTLRVFSKQPTLNVPGLKDKVAAQKAGLGIGFLPRYMIEKEIASGELLTAEVDIEDDQITNIAWRRGKKGKALHWFINRLREWRDHQFV